MVVPLLLAGLVAGLAPACGGKTLLGGDGDSTSDSGTEIFPSTDGGSTCVDIDVAPSDLACGSDPDCDLVRTGEVCDGQCSCGDTPVNLGAAARAQSETASLTLEGCPCADPGTARCIGGQCTLCGFGPDAPAGCNEDAGVITIEDAGILIVDASESDSSISADGNTCVDVDLSTYSQSCVLATDCVLIQPGEVCSGDCACSGSPVNASELSRYEQATRGITFGDCPCPAQFPIECRGNMCVILPP
jgi:hypothetical protein